MGDSKNTTNLGSAFSAYLKNNGLRETFERRVIVDAVSEYTTHFDLDSLAKSIEDKGKHISRATLYNTI